MVLSKIVIVGLYLSCFYVVLAEPEDLFKEVKSGLLAPKCSVKEMKEQLLTVGECD